MRKPLYRIPIGYTRKLKPKYRYYQTIKAATKFASMVHERTGVVLAIELVPTPDNSVPDDGFAVLEGRES